MNKLLLLGALLLVLVGGLLVILAPMFQTQPEIELRIDSGVVEVFKWAEIARKAMWELSNAMQTGSNIKNSLKAILNQIEQEHLIEIEKYGKKEKRKTRGKTRNSHV